MVPWLVLLGRCCLSLSQTKLLGHFLDQDTCLPDWLTALQSWVRDRSTSAQLVTAGLHPGGILHSLQDTLTAVQSLHDSSNRDGAGPAAAAGDASTAALKQQQQDQGTPSAAGAGAASGAASGAEGVVLAGRLHTLGVSLSSLPLSWGCHHPLCSNMRGPAEAGIVQGKGHKCKGCRMAYYCGKTCQEQHWKQHRPVCKAVAAAAASSAAAAKR